MKTTDVNTLLLLLELIANSRIRPFQMPDGSVESDLTCTLTRLGNLTINSLMDFVARLDGVSVAECERLVIEARLDLRDARNELDANRWRLDEMRADEDKGFTNNASWIFHAAAFVPIVSKGKIIILALNKAAMIDKRIATRKRNAHREQSHLDRPSNRA